MLRWRELTRGQRIAGVLLLAMFVVASPMLVFFVPTSLADHIWHSGLVLSGFGAILDPQSFRLRYRATISLIATPAVCRALLGSGVALAVMGLFMRNRTS
jgi:hypothetical protein